MKKKLIAAVLFGILGGILVGYVLNGFMVKSILKEQYTLMEEIQGMNRELLGKLETQDSFIEWLLENYPKPKGERTWEKKKETTL